MSGIVTIPQAVETSLWRNHILKSVSALLERIAFREKNTHSEKPTAERCHEASYKSFSRRLPAERCSPAAVVREPAGEGRTLFCSFHWNVAWTGTQVQTITLSRRGFLQPRGGPGSARAVSLTTDSYWRMRVVSDIMDTRSPAARHALNILNMSI